MLDGRTIADWNRLADSASDVVAQSMNVVNQSAVSVSIADNLANSVIQYTQAINSQQYRTNVYGKWLNPDPIIEADDDRDFLVEQLRGRISAMEGVLDFPGIDVSLRKSEVTVSDLEGISLSETPKEIREAYLDMSRGDVTGVMHHCCVRLEAFARAISGSGDNLGPTLLRFNREIGLDRSFASRAYKEVWPLGSKKVTHLCEGYPPEEIEARTAFWITIEAIQKMMTFYKASR